MTAPLAAAAPAQAPTTAGPAATDSPDGGERFASALDDAVSRGHDGPRGRERAAEDDGAPAEPGPEAPDGELPVADQPGTGQPAVSGAGMPPGLWALFTGIGPATPRPANAVVHTAAGSAVVPVATVAAVAAPADAVAGGSTVAPPVVPDSAPAAAPPAAVPPATVRSAGVPAPGTTGLPAGAVPVVGAPASARILPGTPAPATATGATTDPPPGLTVVLAGAGTPVTPIPTPTPTAPEPVSPDGVVPLPQPAAAPATAEGAGTDTGSAPEQGTPAPAPAPAPTTGAGTPAVPVPVPAPIAAAEPAAPAPPVAGQVAQQVAVLRSAPDGTHTMTVVLTPETLGPVEVQVTLTQGTVELALKSATEAGRAALLEALPELRRDLAGAGLSLTNASVDRDPGGSWGSAQQHAAGDRAGQQGQPDGRGRAWLRGSDLDAGRRVPVATTAVPSPGLDVRV